MLHRKSLFGSACRFMGASAAILAFSCTLLDSDDDDSSGSAAGAAGQGMVSLGGAPGAGASGTAGDTSVAGNGQEPDGCMLETSMCGGSSVAANFKTVNILLVIDKSGSMDDTPDGFEQNKWDALKTALEASLNRVVDDINFGLILYPYSRVEPIALECQRRCCEVPPGTQAINVSVAPGADSVPQILRVLDETSPGGGTPTAAALAGAYEYFTTGEGADLQGDRFVLLATDGGPNCNASNSCEGDRCTTNLDNQCEVDNCCGGSLGERCLDDADVTAQIEALAGQGVPTFVVGIPGTEAYSTYLDQFALAGGVPSEGGSSDYYEVTAEGGVDGLVDVFTSITTQLVRTCEVELASKPPDLEKVNVYIDCAVVPKGEDDDIAWEVDPQSDPSLLHIHGEVCERVQSRGAQRVDVVFGCPTIK